MCADVLIAHAGAELYGSDRMVVETAAAFVGGGHRVVVTVPNEGPLIPLLQDVGASVWVCETPVINKSLLSVRGIVRLMGTCVRTVSLNWRLLRASRADAVIVNTITVPMWLPLARLAAKRVVCHVHEAEGSASRWLKKALYVPVAFAHRVVINSRFALDVMTEAAPWLRSRARVIYNAVAGPPQAQPAREDLAPPVRVLFVGRLSARKGPNILIEAVRRLVERGVEVELSLLGEVFGSNTAFRDGLRNQVSEARLTERVHFLGFQRDIWPIISEHDIVCVPSAVDEPFGNTAVEASLAARPLVVSAIAGLLEASEGAESAIAVPPCDPDAIASAVTQIISGWSQYRHAAIQDRARAAERFSAERYGKEFLSVIS